jgi:hypothetical protein
MSVPVLQPPTAGAALTGQGLVFRHFISLETAGTVSMHREPLPTRALLGIVDWLAGATQPAELRTEPLSFPVAFRVVLDAEGARNLTEMPLHRPDSMVLCRYRVPARYPAAPPVTFVMDALDEAPAGGIYQSPGETAGTGDAEAAMRAAARRAVAHAAAVAVERPRVPELTGDPVEDVRALYGLTNAQLAALLGVTERQMYRMQSERVSSERRERLDALIALGLILIGGLGPDGARRWLESGDPSGSELLRQGRYAELRQRAEGLRDSIAT